jgi:hypothetical protein
MVRVRPSVHCRRQALRRHQARQSPQEDQDCPSGAGVESVVRGPIWSVAGVELSPRTLMTNWAATVERGLESTIAQPGTDLVCRVVKKEHEVNPVIREQAQQVAERVAAQQEALAAGIARVAASFEQTSRVVASYTRLCTDLQRDFMAVFTEQGAALQALADLAAVLTLQDAPHLQQ